MNAVEWTAKIVEARTELGKAQAARDLSACVVANFLSDRIGPDFLGDLEGVRPAVEQYRLRSAEYHAKRRAHDAIAADLRAAAEAVPA